MDAIALLGLFASPPYSIDLSGRSDGNISPKITRIVGIGFLSIFLIGLLATIGVGCHRRKKYKKAVPIDPGVVNSDGHDNNQDATRTDRVELWMDENVASLVTWSDQLNNNNEKTASDKLNIEKHGKNNKAEAMTSNIRVDQLNINKRGKNFLEAEATTSDVGVDRLNINKRGKNQKKEAEATTSNVRVDQLNIDKCDKNDKKEAKTTTSDLKVDQLNIDKRGKNNKKETKATTSEVKVDQLNIDMRGNNDKKETKTTDSEDKLNINEHEKKKLKKGHSEKVAKLIQKVDEQKTRRYTVEDLKAYTENFKERLGDGNFGVVYKGKSPDGVDIAVKVLKSSINWGNLKTSKDPEKLAAEQFMAEVESVHNTHHINVIRLFGFCYEVDNVDNSNPKIALVFEYVENGSLGEYLFGKKKDELEIEKLYDIAIGTDKGLAYLHEECQQKIIHFDIKPENILLDSTFTPKVCDFGLAKLCDRDDTHISVLTGQKGGTYGYMAPEVIQSNQLTNKCDVYSFGMVLFKMVEAKRQNTNNNNESLSDWFPICVRDAAVINNLEVLIGRDCDFSGEHKDKVIRACKVGLLCAQPLPSSRPLMSQVVRMLEGADPINLPQSWPFQNLKPLPTPK